MSNYNFSNTLDGLNNIDANDINTDNIVTDYLTVNINSAVPLVTPYTTNTNQIASCAFVQDAFVNNLLGYAKLNPPTTQTFTGTNTFGVLNANTPTIATNSTRVATTAYVKSNLLNYGLLAPGTAQTFSGENIFDTLRATTPATSTNSTIVATTAYVKSNLANYVTTNTTQTITGNKTFDGTTTLNNLFVSNYVDLTLTTYENQFFGDIYGYRGIVCQNGLYIKDSPGPGANTYALIDTSGNISSTSTISATGNITSNTGIISSNSSDQISIRDPTNNAPSTISQTGNTLTIGAISSNVSPQTTLTLATRSATNAYSVLLSGNTTNLNLGTNSNTTNIQSPNLNISSTSITTALGTTNITGGFLNISNPTTFNDNVAFNLATSMNNTFTFYDGSNATQFDQNGVNLNIYTTGGGIKLGSGFTDNIVCSTNRAYLQGSGGNTIDINGTQATIGGFSVPKITTQPITSSNTNEIASTAFVKNQGYATTIALNNYALLTATQTFTGQQTFSAIIPTAPILIKNTTSTKSGGFIISGNTSYNSINNTDDFAVIAFGSGVNTGILNLTTWAAGSCGIKIDNTSIKFNAGLTCNYHTLSPVPALGVFDIGYNWFVAGATFTNWVGNTGSSPGNVATITFDGIGPRELGTWLVDIVLSTGVVSAPQSYLIWTTVGPANGVYNDTCCHSNDYGLYNSIGVQSLRMSFVLIVTTIPTTYYLNYNRIGGSGLSENKTNSKISFTRMG